MMVNLMIWGFVAGLIFAVLAGIGMVKQQIERGEYKRHPKK